MSSRILYPCGRISRRGFLHQAGGGFFGVALGALWAEAGEIEGAAPRAAFPAQGEVGHLPVHVRRRQPHRHLRSEGQQVGRQADRRHRLRRQRRRDEAAGDPLPPHVHALRQVGHSGLRLVPARRRRDRRDRRGPVDVVPRGEPLPGRDRDLHRPPRPRSSTTRRSGSWVSYALGTRQQEPADVRQHRPRRRRPCS